MPQSELIWNDRLRLPILHAPVQESFPQNRSHLPGKADARSQNYIQERTASEVVT